MTQPLDETLEAALSHLSAAPVQSSRDRLSANRSVVGTRLMSLQTELIDKQKTRRKLDALITKAQEIRDRIAREESDLLVMVDTAADESNDLLKRIQRAE